MKYTIRKTVHTSINANAGDRKIERISGTSGTSGESIVEAEAKYVKTLVSRNSFDIIKDAPITMAELKEAIRGAAAGSDVLEETFLVNGKPVDDTAIIDDGYITYDVLFGKEPLTEAGSIVTKENGETYDSKRGYKSPDFVSIGTSGTSGRSLFQFKKITS